MPGKHVTGPRHAARDLPGPVATILVIAFQDALVSETETELALDQGFVFGFRLVFRDGFRWIEPFGAAGFRVAEGIGQLFAEYFQVLHGIAVDVLESRQPGAIPAREIRPAAHPLRPPCSARR